MNLPGAGRVQHAIGDAIAARLPAARVGDLVRIEARDRMVRGTVSAIGREGARIAAHGAIDGIAAGDRVVRDDDAIGTMFGFGVLGRAIDGNGTPIDGGTPLPRRLRPIVRSAPAPGQRRRIDTPLWTGVRAIDGLLTIGRGARAGIFGAPGTGKSSLLESIAAWTAADAVVVALIGERGREAAQWLERLGARTAIVCATSDRSAPERVRAAEAAMDQAVTLRERGLHVLLLVDSLARYCGALREMRVRTGETAGRGGFPPGVFSDFARWLERAGAADYGSITMVASVLSDGDDERDPVSDAARSLLDGHIALSRELAGAGRFPAIDLGASASRTMSAVVDHEHLACAGRVRAAVARLEQTREAREFGLTRDLDPHLARALAAQTAIESFVLQRHPCAAPDMLRQLRALGSLLGDSS